MTIREFRQWKGMSRSEFADILGISVSRLRRMERKNCFESQSVELLAQEIWPWWESYPIYIDESFSHYGRTEQVNLRLPERVLSEAIIRGEYWKENLFD